MADAAREIEADDYAALAEWLEHALVGVAIEPVYDGAEIPTWQVLVHNGLRGDAREETVLAACESEQEAELVAVALWALADQFVPEEGAQ